MSQNERSPDEQRLNRLVAAAIGIRQHTTAHELAVLRGELLVRRVAADVLATSAIEGVVLDERVVLAAVFHKLCDEGVI